MGESLGGSSFPWRWRHLLASRAEDAARVVCVFVEAGWDASRIKREGWSLVPLKPFIPLRLPIDRLFANHSGIENWYSRLLWWQAFGGNMVPLSDARGELSTFEPRKTRACACADAVCCDSSAWWHLKNYRKEPRLEWAVSNHPNYTEVSVKYIHIS